MLVVSKVALNPSEERRSALRYTCTQLLALKAAYVRAKMHID
jgi:hypothetical protein